MEASGIGESSGSSVTGLRNRNCHCGRRATIKISESQKNPNRLYAKCTDNRCKYFDWLGPPLQVKYSVCSYGSPLATMSESATTSPKNAHIWHRIYMLEAAVGVLKAGVIGLAIFFGVLLALFLFCMLQSR